MEKKQYDKCLGFDGERNETSKVVSIDMKRFERSGWILDGPSAVEPFLIQYARDGKPADNLVNFPGSRKKNE